MNGTRDFALKPNFRYAQSGFDRPVSDRLPGAEMNRSIAMHPSVVKTRCERHEIGSVVQDRMVW